MNRSRNRSRTSGNPRIWSQPMRLAIFALLFSIAPCSVAQVLYGTLTGTVEDATGGVVPSATVKVVSPSTGQERETTTSATGSYTLTNLAPGAYSLQISAQGFQGFQRSNVDVSINTVSRVDVRLQVGDITNRIDVEAGAATLQTDKADVH